MSDHSDAPLKFTPKTETRGKSDDFRNMHSFYLYYSIGNMIANVLIFVVYFVDITLP